MNWGECESKFIRKTEIDKKRINSIIEKAEIRLKVAKTIKINAETIPLSFYEKNKKEFEEIIKIIKNLVIKEAS